MGILPKVTEVMISPNGVIYLKSCNILQLLQALGIGPWNRAFVVHLWPLGDLQMYSLCSCYHGDINLILNSEMQTYYAVPIYVRLVRIASTQLSLSITSDSRRHQSRDIISRCQAPLENIQSSLGATHLVPYFYQNIPKILWCLFLFTGVINVT